MSTPDPDPPFAPPTSASAVGPGLPSASWYADPHQPGQLRYWDGQQWTGHTAPAAAPAYAPAFEPAYQAARNPLSSGTMVVGTAARWAIAACGLVALVGAGVAAWAQSVVSGWARRPSTVDADVADRIDSLTLLTSLLEVAALLLAAVLLMTWLFQLYGSDRVVPAELHHSRSWTIWGWLVPVLAIWRPLQVVRDLWWALAPPADRLRPGLSRPVPVLMRWWWGTWLAMSALGSVDAQVSNRATTLAQLRDSYSVTILSELMTAIAAVVAVVFFTRLASRARPAGSNGVGFTQPR